MNSAHLNTIKRFCFEKNNYLPGRVHRPCKHSLERLQACPVDPVNNESGHIQIESEMWSCKQ